MQKPRYSHATWGLRVADLNSGEVIYNLNADGLLLTGSVRKLFSVGVAINELGADHRFKTPVFRLGNVDGTGTLHGDLVLVAKGDLTMGGRDNGDGTVAVTDFDHVDANNLGSAILTKPDPLAGLDKLAAQVRGAGIARVAGDVVIHTRLFDPFKGPNQKLLITPIIVNDKLINVTNNPAQTRPNPPARTP